MTYAKQNAQKHDDVAGPGHGFVDVFDTDGHLLRRFAARGELNSPWGVVRASFAFARFSGDILIGNFGDGKISVYDSEGHFLDELDDLPPSPPAVGRGTRPNRLKVRSSRSQRRSSASASTIQC